MSHRSVVNLINDVAVSLSDGIQFGYGVRSEFNQSEKKGEQFIWMVPLTASPTYTNNNATENYQKTWNCIILFFKQDKTDSLSDHYHEILNDMDSLVDRFVNRLNDWSLSESDTVGAVTIRNFQQTPYIKADADILTGWWLSFQLVVSDDFNYCTPENVRLYEGN
jgi:hypothetical protein